MDRAVDIHVDAAAALNGSGNSFILVGQSMEMSLRPFIVHCIPTSTTDVLEHAEEVQAALPTGISVVGFLFYVPQYLSPPFPFAVTMPNDTELPPDVLVCHGKKGSDAWQIRPWKVGPSEATLAHVIVAASWPHCHAELHCCDGASATIPDALYLPKQELYVAMDSTDSRRLSEEKLTVQALFNSSRLACDAQSTACFDMYLSSSPRLCDVASLSLQTIKTKRGRHALRAQLPFVVYLDATSESEAASVIKELFNVELAKSRNVSMLKKADGSATAHMAHNFSLLWGVVVIAGLVALLAVFLKIA